MRLHRFYVEQNIGESQELTISDTELIHQLLNVFRFKPADMSGRPGNQVILFDGSGFEYMAEIISLNNKKVVLKIIEASQGSAFGNSKSPALVNHISLYLSVIKKGNFELAVEKCTEIGVAEIHPIISERSEKKDLNIERLNKIIKEASEQSGRVTLPSIFPVTDLEKAVLQVIKEGKKGVAFHTDTDASTASEHNRPGHQNDHPALTKAGIDGRHQVAAFVGPEGGWTEKEMELFKKNNFQVSSLGPNILRAETAAIVAVWEGLRV